MMKPEQSLSHRSQSTKSVPSPTLSEKCLRSRSCTEILFWFNMTCSTNRLALLAILVAAVGIHAISGIESEHPAGVIPGQVLPGNIVTSSTRTSQGAVQYHYSSSSSGATPDGDLLGGLGQQGSSGGYTIRRIIRNFTTSTSGGGINFPDLSQFPSGSQVFTTIRNYTSSSSSPSIFSQRFVSQGGGVTPTLHPPPPNPSYVITRKIIRKKIIRKIIRNGKTELVESDADDDSDDGGFDGLTTNITKHIRIFNRTYHHQYGGQYGSNGGYGGQFPGGMNHTTFRFFNFSRGWTPGNRTYWNYGQREGDAGAGYGQQGWSFGSRYNFSSGLPGWGDGTYNWTGSQSQYPWDQDGDSSKVVGQRRDQVNQGHKHETVWPPLVSVTRKSITPEATEAPVKIIPATTTATSTTSATTTTTTTTSTTTPITTSTTTRAPFSEFSSEFDSVESPEESDVEGTGIIPESSEEVEMIDPAKPKPGKPEKMKEDEDDDKSGQAVPMTAFQQATLIFLWLVLGIFTGCMLLFAYYLLRRMNMLPSCCPRRGHGGAEQHRKLSQEAETQRIISSPEYLRSYSHESASTLDNKSANMLKTTGSALTLIGIPLARIPEDQRQSGFAIKGEKGVIPYSRSISCNVPMADQRQKDEHQHTADLGSAVIIDGCKDKSASVTLIQVEKQQVIPALHTPGPIPTVHKQTIAGSQHSVALPPLNSESLAKSLTATLVQSPMINVQSPGRNAKGCYESHHLRNGNTGIDYVTKSTGDLNVSNLKSYGNVGGEANLGLAVAPNSSSAQAFDGTDTGGSFTILKARTLDMFPPPEAVKSTNAEGSAGSTSTDFGSGGYGSMKGPDDGDFGSSALTEFAARSDAGVPSVVTTVTTRVIKAQVPELDLPTDIKLMEEMDDYFKYIDED